MTLRKGIILAGGGWHAAISIDDRAVETTVAYL
jgi:hypothetical protein